MTIEEGLYAFLSSAGIVGARIYPLVIPQDAALPAIAYQRLSGPREHSHDGASGMAWARMQLAITGESYASAKNTAEQIRAAMDGHKGLMGTVSVGQCLLVNEIDGYAEASDKATIRQQYQIGYKE